MRAEIDKIISLSERDSTDELQNFFSSFTNEQVTNPPRWLYSNENSECSD